MSNPIASLKAKSLAKLATLPTVSEPSPTVSTPSAVSIAAMPPDRPWPSNWPAPAPCPVCLSPGFWVDVYGGGPHCRGCNPPSSPSLAAFAVWVIGTPDAYRWVRNPKAEDEHQHDLDGNLDGDEFVTWQLPSGDTATALRERIDHTRVAGPSGCYSPPLACGPVGDLTLDEWFDRLPEFSRIVPVGNEQQATQPNT